MKKLKLSPSSLKAFLACPRRWYLEYVQRAERVIPAYVTGGSALDQVVQKYLQLLPGELIEEWLDEATCAELAALKPELPTPRTVMVQHKFELPCPGLEDRVAITTGGLDYMTPPNLDLMVIGDLKRIWHKDAAMSEAQLADDPQAQIYAWFVWQVYNPAEVVWRWTYCVRETRNRTTGAVTRKAKAFSVTVKADRARVDAWFERVVLPAARAMLELTSAASAEAVEHDPDSCQEGQRCFVRYHCPLFSGPIKGENQLVDLSRFRTGARPAINPPAPEAPNAQQLALTSQVHDPLTQAVLTGALPPGLLQAGRGPVSKAPDGSPEAIKDALAELEHAVGVYETATKSYAEDQARAEARIAELTGLIEAKTVEGPGAELLEMVPDAPATEPAPPPEASIVPAAPRKRRKAEKQAPQLDAHEAEVVNPPTVETATTEALLYELRDRGYIITLELGR